LLSPRHRPGAAKPKPVSVFPANVGCVSAPAEVRTKRLLLRRIQPQDKAAVVEIHTDPETSKYHPDGPDSPEEAQDKLTRWLAQWERNGIGYWAVVLVATGEIVGFGGLDHGETEGERILNLYYRFRPSAWGCGYASEMAEAAVSWAHRHRPDRPVVIVTRPINAPALRVAEKLGFVRYAQRDDQGVREWLLRLPTQESTIVT
jgi:RimJ/RimL family protein N-acetyltransferase